MEEPIRDPSIPYVGVIAGRFTPGKIIRIQGAVPGIAYRFDINLQCGPETRPRDDIAMHLSVRFLDGFIAMNSLQNGIWGEVVHGNTQPVKRAEQFEILIMCDFNKYKIVINDQLFYDFPQRIHYDSISYLTIEGDVTIANITYGSQNSLPTLPRPGPVPVIRRPPDNDFEIVNGPDHSQPPSYSEVVHNLPPKGQPYPMKSSPYNPGMTAPYPTASSSFPSPSAPNLTLPAGMPVPLNAASSNFRPVSIMKSDR
uniref:Galectin n=1 Tax=Photinus pyralis TaxID=7054 RepID=A0A1Y1KR01_PHOPY